jgi:hypothetical protein
MRYQITKLYVEMGEELVHNVFEYSRIGLHGLSWRTDCTVVRTPTLWDPW